MNFQTKYSERNMHPFGGQHAGVRPRMMVLTCEDLDITIEMPSDIHRSHHKSRELLYTLMELAIEESKR